ncbi:MAG: M23 family metallopeptidase [SAR86 cluster bacterium]|jgi:murein DD-endopeptidase MepM/ murein hydrolase activator NlpD|uniref:M23 family metallopeptidase n=1 Tax=SAR86 cluster bacterium TaxID=2030880 RepID=A0A520MT61_9GAMM|nr:MAG: M23 family metallopeptidase [SAR86 cluster bacterium]|tara:strand:+ start:3111 stop:4355 length:1245 start_codon:yes stop_codon:yes gene_type:complete
MIGFKKPPIKLIVSVFLISFVAIFLIYIDLENNKPLPIEEMTFSEDLSEMPSSVENKRIHEVSKGESLSVIFEDKSVPLNTAYKIFNFDENDLLSSIMPGDKMQFSYIGDELISIEIIKDEINSILIKTKDEISIKKIEKKSQIIKSINKGVITNSFFKNASQIGIPDSIIMDFAYIFGWDVDFVFDVRKGDAFSVIYETDYSEGEKISSGDIIFAEFINKNNRYIAQRFFDDVQGKQYFNENGDNVKKAFLRAPLDFAYISSHFNPNRMHPILHKIKAHNGVDYAAKRNTPIMASGDGVISFVGRQSGYGRTIEIKHGGNIKTLYAHLEKFNKSLKVGSKVKQGNIIGYVGDSGQATGTHLHFEFWQGQIRTDPIKVELPSAKPINKNQFPEFKSLLNDNLDMLSKYSSIEYE